MTMSIKEWLLLDTIEHDLSGDPILAAVAELFAEPPRTRSTPEHRWVNSPAR